MEATIDQIEKWAGWLVTERWPEILVGLTVLGIWRWLMGHKLRDEIATLKKQFQDQKAHLPLSVTIYNASAPDRERQLQDAIESETVRGLQYTIRRLPQFPLINGHSYAPLPEGTNIVTMADGTMRLALPAEVSFEASAGLPEARFSPDGEHGDA